MQRKRKHTAEGPLPHRADLRRFFASDNKTPAQSGFDSAQKPAGYHRYTLFAHRRTPFSRRISTSASSSFTASKGRKGSTHQPSAVPSPTGPV